MGKQKFSLFEHLQTNLKALEEIDNCVKITLGPTGKNAIVFTSKGGLTFLNSGSSILKSLSFKENSANILLQLLEQAATKTYSICGDGSTITILFSCELLKASLRFLADGYSSIFLSNGLKKISYFLREKVIEFSFPISTTNQMFSILKTCLGKKINKNLYSVLEKSISKIGRDGLIIVEENISERNEIESVQGIELDKGFASSYFVNDIKKFEVLYENPYVLVTNQSINSLNQIREIIEYVKKINRPLVIVAEEINKDVISTLVLNNIQKKLKVVVIRYSSIKFLKTGILEDLSILTHSNYFQEITKQSNSILKIADLGQAEKVIITKEKSTFIVSKFSKLVVKRRINELNRELLDSEAEYEKNIFKTRIARLSGNITRIKLGISDKYQIQEQKEKIENAIRTMRSSLEEGILPGGAVFYLYLREELSNWSSLNLIGEEIFATQIVMKALLRPFEELLKNNEIPTYHIFQKIMYAGYPFAYDLNTKEIINSFENGLIDSAKSVRAILWNSISIISTLITSE